MQGWFFSGKHLKPCCPLRVWGLYSGHNVWIMEKKMETIIIMGLYRDKGKERGNYYTGIMEKKMETTAIMGI